MGRWEREEKRRGVVVYVAQFTVVSFYSIKRRGLSIWWSRVRIGERRVGLVQFRTRKKTYFFNFRYVLSDRINMEDVNFRCSTFSTG